MIERGNRMVVLRERPQGRVDAGCFEVVERPAPELPPGGAILQVQHLGIDPTIRGWLDERGNYMAGVGIGEVVRSNGVGVVVETDDPQRFPPGRAFMALTGWQQYRAIAADEFPPVTMVPEGVRPMDVLNVLGHIGLTAYLGITRVGRPQPSETVVVSAAASAVGSVAGQIAKLLGARVVGIAGSEHKCDWVTGELGFDACVNYRTEDVSARLKETCPNGIDLFFDNVGGELLDVVLRRIANRGRIVLCGDISTYDTDHEPPPLRNHRYLMARRARMEGFNTLDHWDSYEEATSQLATWVADGSIKHREHVMHGLEQAPEALVRLFAGDHLGKLVVEV